MLWWCLRSPQLSLSGSCPSALPGWEADLCPVSFPCFLSGSSCSFQSTCLYPVQFPPFPNSCSDVYPALPWCQGWVWPVLPTPGAFVLCSVCCGPQITGYFLSFLFCTCKWLLAVYKAPANTQTGKNSVKSHFISSAQTYLVLNYSLDEEEKENSKDGAKEASEKHLF